MKAIILAGGYAKRLWPLTKNKPKSLLEINGIIMLERILEKLEPLNLDEIIVSTNEKFKDIFNKWLKQRNQKNITLIIEPSMNEGEKLGAIGGINYIIETENINDDILLIAGDNLFDFNLKDFIKFQKSKNTACLAAYDVKTNELAKLYGVISVDSDMKILNFIEKPEKPSSTFIATCCYYLPKNVVPCISEYIKGKNNKDSFGYFTEWFHKQHPVHAFTFKGFWFDIGDIEQLKKADKFMKTIDGIKSIFRSYDIRGIYNDTLTEETMEKIGKVTTVFTNPLKTNTILLARDARTSSSTLRDSYAKGAKSSGLNIIDAGELPMGAAMFHAWKNNIPLAYITASHMSAEWNGIKFFKQNGIGSSEQELHEMRDKVIACNFIENEQGSESSISSQECINNYESFLLEKIKTKKPLKIVLDPGNGMASLFVESLFKKAGFEVTLINNDLDMTFPNRPAEPSKENLTTLMEKTKLGFDLGIAYDGDSDRMTFIDNQGNFVTTEQISYIILSDLLKKEKGPVVVNVECTRLVDKISKDLGCDIKRIRVGHTFLVDTVHQLSSPFGVEISGHFIMPSLVPYDDSMAVSLHTACLLSNQNKSLSDIVSEIPKFEQARINYQCPDNKKTELVNKIKNRITSEYDNTTTIDGVRVELNNGWALIRASGTGPKIRLTIEGDNKTAFNQIKNMFTKIMEEEFDKAGISLN